MNFNKIVCMHWYVQDPCCVSNAHSFWSIFNRVMALDQRQNFVYAQYLVNWFVDFDQILHMHWYWQDEDLDDWTIFFVHFQQSYGPWLLSKFCLYAQYLMDQLIDFNGVIISSARVCTLQSVFAFPFLLVPFYKLSYEAIMRTELFMYFLY